MLNVDLYSFPISMNFVFRSSMQHSQFKKITTYFLKSSTVQYFHDLNLKLSTISNYVQKHYNSCNIEDASQHNMLNSTTFQTVYQIDPVPNHMKALLIPIFYLYTLDSTRLDSTPQRILISKASPDHPSTVVPSLDSNPPNPLPNPSIKHSLPQFLS